MYTWYLIRWTIFVNTLNQIVYLYKIFEGGNASAQLLGGVFYRTNSRKWHLSVFGVFQSSAITLCLIRDGHHPVGLANHRCGGLIVRLSIVTCVTCRITFFFYLFSRGDFELNDCRHLRHSPRPLQRLRLLSQTLDLIAAVQKLGGSQMRNSHSSTSKFSPCLDSLITIQNWVLCSQWHAAHVWFWKLGGARWVSFL